MLTKPTITKTTTIIIELFSKLQHINLSKMEDASRFVAVCKCHLNHHVVQLTNDSSWGGIASCIPPTTNDNCSYCNQKSSSVIGETITMLQSIQNHTTINIANKTKAV